MVSSFGRVKSLHYGEKVLKQPISVRYRFVVLCNNKYRKRYFTHVLLAIVFLNHKPSGMNMVVDHIDGNRLNNNLSNLRVVTQRENASICFRIDKNKFSSKYIGVTWDKRRKKWFARIYISRGKFKFLGYFNSEMEASIEYQKSLNELLNKKRL